MRIEKLPLHKHYLKIWSDLNENYRLIIKNPPKIGGITVAPFISIGLCYDGSIRLIFMIDDLREVCFEHLPIREGVRVNMVYGYRISDITIRTTNFVSPEIAKKIHDGFMNAQKLLNKCKQQAKG